MADMMARLDCVFLLISCVWAACLANLESTKQLTRTEFLQKLLKGYDQRVPPNFDSEGPTNVTCDIFIGSFDSISEQTMDFVMSIFMRQKWFDSRLAFGHLSNESMITLDARMSDALWLPDLFFTNEKKAYFHEVTVPNRFIRLYQNGTIYYSARVSLTLSCPMQLQKFPLDTQICSMQMESYAYTLDKLQFGWRVDDPVELNDDLELPQFKLDGHELKDCTKHYSTGSFTCLQVDFVLTRDVGFYMIQTYIPSSLIVILSWVSFWINIDAVPARISLGVLTILTMTTQTTGSRQSQPRVSYIKAIDVWMATCLLFVFSALLEFAIVNVLSRKEIRRMVTMRRQNINLRAKCVNGNGPESYEMMSDGDKIRHEKFVRDPDGKHKARNVDKIARKLFPFAFFLFNVIYWVTYVFWNANPRH